MTLSYDANGNITEVRGGSALDPDTLRQHLKNDTAIPQSMSGQENYTYDAKGQLIRHDSATQNASFTYSYDKAGNITAVSKYAYTTGTLGTALETKNYTYATGTWGDLLTNYNGKAISYDAIGNMTSYDDATFTWEGRSLASLSKGGSSYSYRYNADGIRTGKTVNGTVTEYFLSGSQILAQKTGNSVMWFFYDSQGTRTGLVYDGHFYYYLYNVQGDVVALADSANGQLVARYDYDAWGKCTVTNATGNTVGDDNPFRYRGYYYDTDTGLYYLNSRYYDPELRRFISSDEYASTGQGQLGNNMFAYCLNNPVNMADNEGQCAHIAAGAFIGALTGFVGTLISSGNVGDAFISAAFGAVSGALCAAVPTAAIAIDAAFSAAESVTIDCKNHKSVGEIVVNAAVSAGFSLLTSGRGNILSEKSTHQAINEGRKAVTTAYRPAVKKAAQKQLNKLYKKIGKEVASEALEWAAETAMEKGTQWYLRHALS